MGYIFDWLFFILKLITDEGKAPVRKSFGECMKILKGKRREKNKRHPPIKRKVPVEYPCPSLSPTTTRSQSASHASESANTRYRIVNWGYLSEQLDKCAKCGVGPLNLKNTTNERQAGLGYLTRIGCDYCQETNVVRTDEVHTEMNQRGQKRFKLNERCVLGTLHSGNGIRRSLNIFFHHCSVKIYACCVC